MSGYYDEQQFQYNIGDFAASGYEEQLQFQTFDPNYDENPAYSLQTGKNTFLDPDDKAGDFYGNNTYQPSVPPGRQTTRQDDDEPPLLEELGIDPQRIVEKTVAVLNPFRRKGPTDDAAFLLQDSDLAGPLMFCVIMAVSLLITGGKAHFGFVYGLAFSSCILMYCIINLMSIKSNVSFASVASILGYCLLPLVTVPFIGLFSSGVGIFIASVAVIYSSLSASRLFVTVLGDHDQRALLAYPCALVYGAFALIIIF